MKKLINFPSTDTGYLCKMGVKSKLVVTRGSTGPQRSACMFRCGVLVWVYCLTSYSSICSWIEYHWGDCSLHILQKGDTKTCRSCGGRDRMVGGLTTPIHAISAYHLLVRIPQIVRWTRYNIMWLSLSVICDRSVVFSRYSSFLCK